MGNRVGQKAGAADPTRDFWSYDGRDYRSEEEAKQMRANNLAYVLGDKNLARNAYVDMKYGGGTGAYDYFSGEQSVNDADWKKYSNVGKLGWNGINELVTDPNDIRALFGGQSITDATGRSLGDLYGGDQFINPTTMDRTIDNSHTNKNPLIKTDIYDTVRGAGYQGAQMDLSKLYSVGNNKLFDDALDDMNPTAKMLGDYGYDSQYVRAPELTGAGQALKFALQTFGGPVGSIAGLALQGAGGQRPGFGQMLGTFVGMSGGTGNAIGDAAVGAAGQGVDAWRNGGKLSDILKSAAVGGASGYLGNQFKELSSPAIKDLLGSGAVSDMATKGINNAVGSAIKGGLSGAVNGNFNLSSIGKNAALAGLTGAAGSGIGAGLDTAFGNGTADDKKSYANIGNSISRFGTSQYQANEKAKKLKEAEAQKQQQLAQSKLNKMVQQRRV